MRLEAIDLSFGYPERPIGRRVSIAIEPGVVVATDANNNMLEIIWPQLAGFGLGAPILRLHFNTWTPLAKPGAKVDVNMTFNAVGPNGAPATFTAAARGLTLPALK